MKHKTNNHHTFEIVRVIPENLVPDRPRKRKSKYDPIINTVKVLEKGESLKIKISSSSVQSQVKKLIDNRLPGNDLEVKTIKSDTGTRYLYITNPKNSKS